MGGRTAPLEGLIFLLPLSGVKKKRGIFIVCSGICCIRRKYGSELKAHHTPMLILWNGT